MYASKDNRQICTRALNLTLFYLPKCLIRNFLPGEEFLLLFAVDPDQNNSLTRHYQCHNIIYKMTVVKHPRLIIVTIFKQNQQFLLQKLWLGKNTLQNLLQVFIIIFKSYTILTNWKFGRINHCPNLTKKIWNMALILRTSKPFKQYSKRFSKNFDVT